MKKSVSLFIILIAAIHFSIAQPAGREVVNQSIEWFSATANFKLNKTFTLMGEGQFRFAREFEPMQQQARVALDIRINDHLSIAPLGYVYTWNYQYGKQPAEFKNHEHRIWQQIFYKHAAGRFQLDHRLRFEQRFIQVHSHGDGEIVDEGYTNRQSRIRYRFMARIPLNNKNIDPGTYFASLYDEAFLSFGKSVTFHEPDQNRIFAGLGYQFDEAFSVQGGFLYQMMIKANGAQQENNTGFLIALNYVFDPGKSIE